MKRKMLVRAISAALVSVLLLMVILSGCGRSSAPEEPAAPDEAVEPDKKDEQAEPDKKDEPAEPDKKDEPAKPAEPDKEDEPDEPAKPDEPEEPPVPDEPDTGRKDGERYEKVIMIEGMEETVGYEHIINESAGFEMGYEYETFNRQSTSDGESFVLIYDDPGNPENYLDVKYHDAHPDTIAVSIADSLSNDYDIDKRQFELEGAGTCTRIDASVIKGTNNTADKLQTVYIIPAGDGCLVAEAHYTFESADGFGKRFSTMVNTISLLNK